MSNYLERYKAGEHKAVWDELLMLGDAVRQPAYYAGALTVARETMSRVRQNVEILVPRLQSFGFEFGFYPDGEPIPGYQGAHIPPPARIVEQIDALENRIGLIPISLRAFWEVVGAVDFVAAHKSGEYYDLDPLVVSSFDGALYEYDGWLEECEGYEDDEAVGGFAVSIAPDALHKDNISGGLSYQIPIPTAAIDAPLLGEPHETEFVEYLRICFRRGGFPGRGAMPVALTELIEDLLPF